MTADRRLRVAIDITPTVGQGYGVGRYVVDLLDGLANVVELHGVYQGHHGMPPEAVIDRCTSVQRYDLLGGRVGAVVRLPWVLRRIAADLYHSTSTIAIPGPGWRGALVATVHDLYPLHTDAAVTPRHARLFRQLLKRILAHADHLIVPSARTRRDLLDVGYRGPISITPNGVTASPSQPRPAHAPPRYILTISAIEPRKGFDLLAQALLMAKESMPPWIHIGGIRHDPEGTIVALMERCGCRRLGWVDDPTRDAWLQHATVLACPSRLEGYGYSVADGMAAGVAVVATEGGSQGEVLGTGWEPCPVANLAHEVHRLLNDADYHRSRVRRGLQRASELTVASMASQTLAAYRASLATATTDAATS
jgi:glycosyltransferase involved in cell wall biosynthesis